VLSIWFRKCFYVVTDRDTTTYRGIFLSFSVYSVKNVKKQKKNSKKLTKYYFAVYLYNVIGQNFYFMEKDLSKYYASIKDNIPSDNLFARLVIKKGITQKEFAKLIGKSTAMVGNYFKGRREMPFSKLVELADQVGVSIKVIMEDTTPNEKIHNESS